MEKEVCLEGYMNDYIETIKHMGKIINIEWIDCYICPMIIYTDNTGKSMIVSVHHATDGKNGYIGMIDAIIHNHMLKKVFQENGIDWVPEYPLDTKHIEFLIYDGIRLLALKKLHCDISDFEFHYEKQHWKLEADPEADPGAEADPEAE